MRRLDNQTEADAVTRIAPVRADTFTDATDEFLRALRVLLVAWIEGVDEELRKRSKRAA
jgi:hypothetical protein